MTILGISDCWYVKLFAPIVLVIIAHFIALVIYPYQTFEVVIRKLSDEQLCAVFNDIPTFCVSPHNVDMVYAEFNRRLGLLHITKKKIPNERLDLEIEEISEEISKLLWNNNFNMYEIAKEYYMKRREILQQEYLDRKNKLLKK